MSIDRPSFAQTPKFSWLNILQYFNGYPTLRKPIHCASLFAARLNAPSLNVEVNLEERPGDVTAAWSYKGWYRSYSHRGNVAAHWRSAASREYYGIIIRHLKAVRPKQARQQQRKYHASVASPPHDDDLGETCGGTGKAYVEAQASTI